MKGLEITLACGEVDDDSPQLVWRWTVCRDGQAEGGGMCATCADAYNDASVYARQIGGVL